MLKKISLHLVLHQPEIPQNTGSIIRLAANTGAHLHLIKPFGFEMSAKRLRRAGLDYIEFSSVTQHRDYGSFLLEVVPNRIFAVSTKGSVTYSDANFKSGDAFLFGSETRGLPPSLLNSFQSDNLLTIPMKNGSRSLNLANAVSIICYEAWRQLNFKTLN